MMENIPSEVKTQIISELVDKDDLCNVRLVSKAFSDLAAKGLFSRYHIKLPSLHDDSNSEDEEDGNFESQQEEPISLTRLNHILARPALAKHLRTLHYTTSAEPNKDLQGYHDDHSGQKSTRFRPIYKTAIDLINRVPNLKNLEVEFSCVCALDDPNENWRYMAQEGIDFRSGMLQAIFGALTDPEHPIPNFASLSIKNLQNYNDKELIKSSKFRSVLSRLSDLRLRIIQEEHTAAPEASYRFDELQNFMDELPSSWLQPCRDNLTSLTLHSIDHWGFSPCCDFRKVGTFPQLKRLGLGNYTFSHDWQLDWILSHSETLETLVLDNCMIIKKVKNYMHRGVDFDKEPFTAPENANWAYHLRKIEKGLVKLRTLVIGARRCDDGETFDTETVKFGGFQDLYIGFDGGFDLSPWGPYMLYESAEAAEAADVDPYDVADEDTKYASIVSENQEEEDQAAYENLLRVLTERYRT